MEALLMVTLIVYIGSWSWQLDL